MPSAFTYNIDPNNAAFVASTTQAEADGLKEALDLTDQAVGDTSSALQESPMSQRAVQRCLEMYVKFEVETCYRQAKNMISCTTDACRAYIEGDATMSMNLQSANSSVSNPNAPGTGNSSRGGTF